MRHYEKKKRYRAAELLVDSVEAAFRQIEAGPDAWKDHPSNYADLKAFGFRWIRRHRYWFGYLEAEIRIVTNVLFDTSYMPTLVADIDDVISAD